MLKMAITASAPWPAAAAAAANGNGVVWKSSPLVSFSLARNDIKANQDNYEREEEEKRGEEEGLQQQQE